MKLLFALTTGVVLASGVSQQRTNLSESLQVKLSLVREVVAIDGVIEPDITFVNVGSAPFYVERSDSIGPQDIEFIARDAECEYTASSFRPTIPASYQRFLLIPFRPGERSSQMLNQINDLEPGGSDLLLPREGKYSLTAVFHSQGETVVDGLGPVWRGTVTSDPVTLIVVAPSPGKVDRMREQLEQGVTTGAADPDSIAYFRHVRDETAADLLIRLVAAGSVDPWLAEAIAHQRRPRDAEALETLSRRLSRDDPRFAESVLDLAKRLRASKPCDPL